MSGIMQRINNIRRSHAAEPEIVDNYADTVGRLDAAMVSITTAVNDLSSQKQALRESVKHYLKIFSAYEIRETLLGKLIDDPKVVNSPEAISLYETAKKLRGISERWVMSGHERVTQLNESIDELQARREGLAEAKAKLGLAQQINSSRERLAQISSRSSSGELPVASDYREELRAATALAREAEALAELKGLPA